MSKITFGAALSDKAKLRAELAKLNIAPSKAPMAAADDLKANSNVPSMNFRGTHTKASRPGSQKPSYDRNASKVDNSVRIVVDHCGREFYQNAEGEWL